MKQRTTNAMGEVITRSVPDSTLSNARRAPRKTGAPRNTDHLIAASPITTSVLRPDGKPTDARKPAGHPEFKSYWRADGYTFGVSHRGTVWRKGSKPGDEWSANWRGDAAPTYAPRKRTSKLSPADAAAALRRIGTVAPRPVP